ncbi:ABC-ATPase domain-containing protein [Faecalicatena fissicatena]|uniref:ABC-ATPase domain-containing protein n=1 Tax=Faecalicatena fissicatena TaxID=290055 RepID=UPI00156EE16F|nr:ABC-ATPase domain-containing protein [Faecalicatena fissicatena]NSE34235.1 ABC-ATPase domain-containing protein [Faecalicatena fissicatena]
MKMAEELQRELRSINRKSYPAYKGLKGAYQFPDYQLFIEHVQGDPFAAPSALRIFVPHSKAKFPERYYWDKCSKVALQDALLRRFAEISAKFCYQAKGSGKSGVIQVSNCGQEVLERTACEITKEGIHIRFFVGFPANGRTINSGELEKILFVYLPKCVEMSLYHRKVPERETEQVICLKEDQRVIREELKKRGLIAFVANGSILPRQSGNSDLPMKDAVPFQSPKSMEITIQLRHRGSITGMGIRKGITLIAGGGYHGKSTLLQALEKGVYDHIAGDGREFVITDDTAWKLRAEDGRKIKDVDISLFINHLPNGRNTRRFSTLDASGSTSQAANIIEAIEAKSQVLLIDEDTSATNFMVRDELMQRVIQKDKEPITPFLERARDLYEKAGISTILVVGSCGSYFYIADQIIQMDNYCPVDITEKTRKLLKEYKKPDCEAKGFALPSEKRSISFGSSVVRRKNYRGTGMVEEHEKLKVMGRESLMLGKEQLDLRYLEQLADREQTQTLGYLLKYAKEQYSGKTTDLTALMESLIRKLEKEGIGSVSGQKEIPAGMAMPRRQEIYACFNRF